MQHDHFLKKVNFDLVIPPLSIRRGRTQAFDLKSRLICSIFIVRNFSKNIDNCVIATFKYLTFGPHLRGQVGGVIFQSLSCLSSGTE